MKHKDNVHPHDAHHFESIEEMIEYIKVEHLGEETPRSRNRARAEDITTRGTRLAGSGWSNLRRS